MLFMMNAVSVRRPAVAWWCAIAAVFVLVSVPPAAAQQQLGAIQGTIADQTGGVLPGVTVTVRSTGTDVARTTTTNERGVYRVQSLDPGRYEVTAELMGFRKAVRSDVTLSVGTTLGVNFELQPGVVTELVEVVGVAPDIQTEKADISAVVELQKINDLPLLARNPLALAALQPGGVGL